MEDRIWAVALECLKAYGLGIRCTDLSYLLSGDVALRHLVRTLPPQSPSRISPLTVSNLERIGITHLSDLGHWQHCSPPGCPPAYRFAPYPSLPSRLQGFAAGRDLPQIIASLQHLSINQVTQHLALGPKRAEGDGSLGNVVAREGSRVDSWPEVTGSPGTMNSTRAVVSEEPHVDDGSEVKGSPGTVDSTRVVESPIPHSRFFLSSQRAQLVLPRAVRQHLAEQHLLAINTVSTLSALPSSLAADNVIACDASAVNRPPFSSEHPHVTFAITSSRTSCIAALQPPHAHSTSLTGEVYALLFASLHALSHFPHSQTTIYSDHLNSVHALANTVNPVHSPFPSNPAYPLYRWLRNVIDRHPLPPIVSHVHAHTSSSSIPAQVNRHVDYLASHAHHSPAIPLPVPFPTFSLNDFSLFSPNTGFICSSIASVLSTLRERCLSRDITYHPNLTLCRSLYNPINPPAHPYTRASSAFSALVQLYARAGQLDTALVRSQRFGNCLPGCSFHCDAIETAHHVFVTCPTFQHYREHALSSVLRDTSNLLDDAPLSVRKVVLDTARSLFHDDVRVWPQHLSHFYLGTLPKLPLPEEVLQAHIRVFSRVVQSWHNASIQLAARIWGEYKRRCRAPAKWSSPGPLDLPSNLLYLLSR